MLKLFGPVHCAFDRSLKPPRDLDFDQHHPVKYVGIAWGEAFHRGSGRQARIMRADILLIQWMKPRGCAAIDSSADVRAAIRGDTPGQDPAGRRSANHNWL